MKGGVDYAKDGLEVMKKELVNNVIVFLVAAITCIAFGVGIVSMFYCANKARKGEKLEIGDALWALKNNPVQSIILAIVFMIPFYICLLPGLYFGPQWIYAFAMLAREDEKDAIAAIKASMARTKAAGGIVDHLVRFIILGLVGYVGNLICGIGGLVTNPIAVMGFDAAYDDLPQAGGGEE
jgi:hypothetical protein